MVDDTYIRAVSPGLLIKANAHIVVAYQRYGSVRLVKSVTSNFARDHSVEELLALSHRLMALARLIGSGQIGQWTKDIKDWRLLNKALFRAAARAPLRESALLRDIKFDPQEFLRIALQEVGSEGAA